VDGEATPARRSLPLRRILFGAFALSARHWRELARATGLPILAVIACTLIQNAAGLSANRPVEWTLYFVYVIALSWLAISIHRLVLAEDTGVREQFSSTGLKRLGRFVGTVIGAWLSYLALMLVMLNVMVLPWSYVPVGQGNHWLPFDFGWFMTGAKILAMWPIARLSLLFPALAVDQVFDPIAAWKATRGNGWKLAVVVGALPWALRSIADAMYRDEATWVEFGALLVLTAVFTVIQVVALSLSYWELTRPEPPPTPPPV
jgi:hypothetical protein